MAKGLEKHKERLTKIQLLGKDLARRSRSKCELCSVSGVALKTYEIPKAPEEPDIDHCLLICETCLNGIENPKQFDINHWRVLNDTVWSDVPGAQVMAVRILRRIGDAAEWAPGILEHVYLEESQEEWINSHSI